jgi:DNA repair exonuclease SbcCD ATPase subunit
MSTKLRREGSADASGTNIRKTVRLAADEVAQAGKATAATISRSNTSSSAAYGTNIGDAVVGEDSLSLITKISRLEKDLERRKESYVGREEAYKDRVTALEEELAAQNRGILQPKKTDSKLHELKAIQAEILESVELVQDRTARIMQEQERDLLRSFRARLFDVQTELEKEKSKKDDGLAAWRERFTQLEAELDWATEVSQRLDKVNATLTEENNELKLKFASQEQDRNLFIELLVSLKKDNALWRSKNAELIAENERLKVQVTGHSSQQSYHTP